MPESLLTQGIMSWRWLCKEKVRFWIFVGPSVCLTCVIAVFLSPLGSSIETYIHLLPIISIVSHICPGRVFTRTPPLLFGMWLATAIFSLIALAVVGAEFAFPLL